MHYPRVGPSPERCGRAHSTREGQVLSTPASVTASDHAASEGVHARSPGEVVLGGRIADSARWPLPQVTPAGSGKASRGDLGLHPLLSAGPGLGRKHTARGRRERAAQVCRPSPRGKAAPRPPVDSSRAASLLGAKVLLPLCRCSAWSG